MKSLVQNPVFKFLSDLKLAAVLLAIFAIASGVATWLESYYAGLGSTETGRAAAYDMVYDAAWFNGLLILLFVNLLLNLVRRLARGRQPLGFLLVHVGMLVILAGAGVTRWYGYEGYLRIREGQANNVVSSAKTYAVVQKDDRRAYYPVRLYRPGDQNVSRTVPLGDDKLELGVAEYWSRFEEQMVPGPGGVAQVTFGTMGEQGMQMATLVEGGQEQIAGATVRFLRGPLPEAGAPTSRFGDIRVRVGDQSCSLPVKPEPGPAGECGGWTFEITEFQTDYRTGGPSNPDGPMLNPMVRVAATSPSGETAEKILFALHPDFAMMHDEDSLLAQVDMLYQLNNGIDLARDGDTIVMRSSSPMVIADMGGGNERELPAGQTTVLEDGKLIRSADGFQAVTSGVHTSLVSRPVQGANPNAPEAARMYVRKNGERAEALCIKGDRARPVQLGGETYLLSFGSILKTLPYELFLKDFVLDTYPGSDNPASYESHVLLNDPEKGIEGQPVRIWMNNPLNHRGTKHFQSSYDRDRRGTVLSINKDPGKMPTYIGYTILSVGFFIIIGRIVASRSQGKAGNMLGAALIMAAAAALAPTGALAQDHPTSQEHPQAAPSGEAAHDHDHDHAHDHAPAMSAARSIPPVIKLSPESHDAASRLIVQDWRGRMKPLDTLARETAVKISKKTKFEGREPVESFLGYVVHPQQWYRYPCIAVKNPGVQKLLGVSGDTHHVSLASLLDGGGYKLNDVVNEAHRTPANKRNKTQQKLIGFDERVHLLYTALQGTSLRIFPMPDDPGHTWHDVDKVLNGLPAGDPRRAEFEAAADALFGGLSANDPMMIARGINLVSDLQHKYGHEVMPSDARVSAEIWLNTFHPFAKATLPYMGAFVLLIIAFFISLFRHDGRPWTWRNPLYSLGMLLFVGGFVLHTAGFATRWVASGRAPLSNGHESLLWVALSVALAGLIFELLSRTAAAGALSALLTPVVLGVSFMGAFDPAIGPLVPVLASYWLNIHVTIITASYGFLGLCCLLGLLTLVLYLTNWRGTNASTTRAIAKLDKLNVDVMIAGIGLLSVGTLLGGVWANESWGRYWGWDPKETWALVSILIYATILHFRWIPKLNNPFVQAAGSFLSIWSIVMTYFGVNYLLVGLHSYAAGEAVSIPQWIIMTVAGSSVLTMLAYFAFKDQSVKNSGGRGLAADA